MTLDQQRLLDLKESLNEIEGLLFAYLFGSFATNRADTDSDLDIGIYLNRKLSWQELTNLETILSKRIKVEKIDIVEMRFSDVIINNQIVRNGILVIDNNHTEWLKFRARQFSMYIDFKRSRRIIEQNLDKPILK